MQAIKYDGIIMVAKPLVITAKVSSQESALIEYQIKHKTSAKFISFDIEIDPDLLLKCAVDIAAADPLRPPPWTLAALWQYASNLQSPISLYVHKLSVDKRMVAEQLHSYIAFNYYHLHRISNIFISEDWWGDLANQIEQSICPPSFAKEGELKEAGQLGFQQYELRITNFIKRVFSSERTGTLSSEPEFDSINDFPSKKLPFYFSMAALGLVIKQYGYVMSSTDPELFYSHRGNSLLSGEVRWLGTTAKLQSAFQFFVGSTDDVEAEEHHLDVLKDTALLCRCLNQLQKIALTTVNNSKSFLNGHIYMSLPKARKTGWSRYTFDSDSMSRPTGELRVMYHASEGYYDEIKNFFSSKRNEINIKAYEQLVSDYPDIASTKLIEEIRETEIGVLPLALEREAATLLNLKFKLLIENTASAPDVASFKSVAAESIFDDRQAYLKQKNLTPADSKTVQYLNTILLRNLVLTCFNELVKEGFLLQTAVNKNDLIVYLSKANANQIIVEVPLHNQLAFEQTHSLLVIFWL
jgi:hypothetical protein